MRGASRGTFRAATVIERLTEHEDQRNEDGRHKSSLFDVERNFNQRTAYDVSGRHNR